MYLIYLDESGNYGLNLNDSAQPVFVLAALLVLDRHWASLESGLSSLVESYFPDRPSDFEIHAHQLRSGRGYFRSVKLERRMEFRDECLLLAHQHDVKLIYRAIEKRRYLDWLKSTFGTSLQLNPHIAAFPLISKVINDYLKQMPESALGLFISDENREIIADVERSIHVLRGVDSNLRLSQIVEKGFFIDSRKSKGLQLCDLCAYYARAKEEARIGVARSAIDSRGIALLEPLIHVGDEASMDVLKWLVSQQKKERPGA